MAGVSGCPSELPNPWNLVPWGLKTSIEARIDYHLPRWHIDPLEKGSIKLILRTRPNTYSIVADPRLLPATMDSPRLALKRT